MGKSVYYINTANGKRESKEIAKDLSEADTIIFEGGERTKDIKKQEKLVRKMNMPIWYRPKYGFLT